MGPRPAGSGTVVGTTVGTAVRARVLGVALVLAAAALAPVASGPWLPVARAADPLAEMLGEWAIVSRRRDEAGETEQRAVLARIAALETPESRAALRRLRDEYGSGDSAQAIRILGAEMVRADPEAVDQAIRWVEDRRDALLLDRLGEALAEVGNPESRRQLRERLLSRAPPPVKVQIVRGFGLAGDREAVPAILFLLRETNLDVRVEALDALGAIGDLRAGGPIQVFLHDPDPWVREAAARALGTVSSARSVPPLLTALSDPAPRVAESAAASLARLDAQAAVPALVARLAAVGESDLRLAAAFARALEKLTGKGFGVDPQRWVAWWEAVKDRPWSREALAPDGTTLPGRRYYGFPVHSSRLVFVLDVSRSMGWNDRLESAKGELIRVLQELPASTRFNLVIYSDVARAWAPGLQEATPARVRRAVAFVGAAEPDNGTNTADAIRLALADPEADTVFFLSDGHPTIGDPIDPERILLEVRQANRHRRVQIHCVALLRGAPPPGWAGMEDRLRAASFLRRLADQSGGHVEVVE